MWKVSWLYEKVNSLQGDLFVAEIEVYRVICL